MTGEVQEDRPIRSNKKLNNDYITVDCFRISASTRGIRAAKCNGARDHALQEHQSCARELKLGLGCTRDFERTGHVSSSVLDVELPLPSLLLMWRRLGV